jgi:hypothetical protein
MGLFSSRKKTYVSSVVYNLAGPVEDRPDYLKSVILGNLLTRKNFRPGKVLQESYGAGIGLRLRGYHRWARTNYQQVGISKDSFQHKRDINADVVAAAMLSDFEITASIDWVDTGPTAIEMWGRQWLRENMPAKEQEDVWRVDFVEATEDALIIFSDGTPNVLFKPTGYRKDGQWLYVSYSRPLTTNRWTTPQLFIYRRGSGSGALDALFTTAVSNGEYLPFIPLRHETKFISETYKPEVYKEAKAAYKKAIGQNYDDLIDKVKDTPDLGEIDFAYVFFGVSYNTKDMASRRYMFRFFRHLHTNQMSGAGAFDSWVNQQPIVDGDIRSWLLWSLLQQGNPPGSPVTGPAPDRTALTGAPGNSIVIEDKGPGKTNLKMEISWASMQLYGGVGLGKPDAKKGDVWFTFTGGQEIVASAYTEDEVEDLTIDTIEAYHQVSLNVYEKLTIRGMVHVNHIYNGKSVEITAAQALLDDDDSGFLVPINYDIFREMSLVDSTQVGTQCATIVFNCYTIVKKKWYQTGWFKVLLIVVIVVITVITGGAGAASIGLLGANAVVGAALGFIGLAATIAGALANMVAAMIVTKLITYMSVELLGEKIGLIVAAIAAVVTLQIGTALQAGQSMASLWSSFMEPMNLLALTNSVGNAYAGVIQQGTMDIMEESKEALNDYRKQSLELQENYAEQFGYGTALFDPMSLIEAGDSFFTESSEAFLGRTLLTGSDIARMSNDLITDFVELSLRSPFSEDE